jgi:1,2-diacylglycerol 3-beta-galactosyltransferase
MIEPKRVLILTADAGFGHRSAANAIAAALEEKYGPECLVEIANPLDDERTPSILRDSQEDYDRLVREMPEVYKLRYQFSDNAVPASIMESAVTVMLFKVIQDLIQRSKPDVIVATHPLYPAPLSAVIATGSRNVPFVTAITDLGKVHRSWFNPAAALTLAPTEAVRVLAAEYSIPAEKVRITGIPVDPRLLQPGEDKHALRQRLGWQPDLTTVLVAGSKRVKKIADAVHVINHSGFLIQLALVAGGDDELHKRWNGTEWHLPAHLYNYVKNMPEMMRAADLIVSKAGGLIVTEALACGLPLLLVDVTPGQEEGNAAYVVENGAGELADTPLKVLETLAHWLGNGGQRLAEHAAKACGLGRPQAAAEAAELIYEAAQREPAPFSENTLAGLPKLIEWLGQFGLVGPKPAGKEEPQAV